MKNLFKNKKIIISISSALTILLIFGIVFSMTHQNNEFTPTESVTNASETSKDVVIDTPENDNSTDETASIGEIEDDGNALKPDESIENTVSKTPGKEAETNATPKKETDAPAQDPENNAENGSRNDGNPPVEEAFSCGYTNHHCQNAEFHASLLNRELDGCPYCGSHSCPSFYAVNEWGYTKYDPALCPKYNVQKDSAEYCPNCGRKMWSPDNPTGCFSYLQDTQCECGEYVPANTCHHH